MIWDTYKGYYTGQGNRKVTIQELIEELKNYPMDALVVQSKDAEGNMFSPVSDLSIGRYAAETTWYGEFGLLELTEYHRKKGYTEEDVPNGPPAVCIWPSN